MDTNWKVIVTSLLTVAWSMSAQAGVQGWRYEEIMEKARKAEAESGQVHLQAKTQAPQEGEIESLTLDPNCAANDNWCGGTMVIGGQTITIPRNLLIDFPANRLSLKQAFSQAPAACVAAKQSGLARNDTCRITTKGSFAILSSNRNDCGQTIVADLFIANGPEAITSKVSFINYTDGYFRLGGTQGVDAGGTLVRINDPSGRNTIQQGTACLAGSQNCSPDIRFTNDPDNYTVSYMNGYPVCIPSRVVKGGHTVAADANGNGDPLCPALNRTAAVAPNFFVNDSRRFAPMLLGDTVTAEGGFVTVGGVTFLSAHTVTVMMGLSTRETANQPDYIKLERSVWALAPFVETHSRATFTGFSTLPDSQIDIFALRVDPRDNSNHEDPLSSTVGNPRTTNKLIAGPGGKFQIQLDIHFAKGAPVTPSNSPCTHLLNAGFDVCPTGGSLAEEFSLLSPPSREIIGRTRRTVPLTGNVFTLDIQGRRAQNGEYVQPLGAGLGGLILAESGEADLSTGFNPIPLEALPWTLDRRTSPTGCVGNCESTAQPLIPYPASGVDLVNASIANGAPATAANRVITFFTNGDNLTQGLLPFPPADSCPAVETLTVGTAQFRIFTRTWTVSGTSNRTGPGNQITIFSGPTATGTVIGVAPVSPAGIWSLNQANSPVPQAARVSVQSSFGTKLENVPVTIRN